MPGHALTPGMSPVQSANMRVLLAQTSMFDNQRQLGDLGNPFAAIASIAGGIFGGIFQSNAQKEAAKSQERAATAAANASVEQARITADAYKEATAMQMKAAEKAADYQFRAAKAKADADLAAVREQYGSALDALRTQRMAAIDQQASSLISNTSAAIFSLSGQGLQAATKTATTFPKAGVAGIVLLGVATMFFLNPPYARKKKGEKSRALRLGKASYDSKHSYDRGDE